MFRLVDGKWGPQLLRFDSKFASPGCSGVNALVQDWSGENNWGYPLVGLVVDHSSFHSFFRSQDLDYS